MHKYITINQDEWINTDNYQVENLQKHTVLFHRPDGGFGEDRNLFLTKKSDRCNGDVLYQSA
jgi:hypothetical protein